MTDFNTYDDHVDAVVHDLDELTAGVDSYLRKANVTEPFHYRRGRVEAITTIEAILAKADLTPVESMRAGNLLRYALRAGDKAYNGDFDKGFEMDTDKAANYLRRLVTDEWMEA